MKKNLSITFILPFVNLTGGIKILFEHANRLVKRGHAVTIVYPGKLFHGSHFEIINRSWRWLYFEAPLRQLKYWLFVSLFHKTDAAWFPLDRRIQLIRTPDLSARYMPAGDIVIATAPETVPWVATYPADKGIKVHFAQDYEVWYLPEHFIDSTFQYNDMHLITIGSWQKKLYEGKFSRVVEAVIPDGVDTMQFTPSSKAERRSDTIRILMSYHHASYKGISDGLVAIEYVKKAGFRIQTVMFGVHPLKNDLPHEIEYHQSVAEAELPALYRSCDIFLWPTHREGFGLPPMEAMACGLPVVGTDAGAMTDYVDNGTTGFIVPIKKPKQLAEKLITLVKDEKLRLRMGQAAAQAMKHWGWDQQTAKLEHYLMTLIKERRNHDRNHPTT